MPNCLPYGSNRLFLFWMLTKLRKLGFQTNLITTQKTVENYVDKIVVTATMNSRKPTMTTLASEYSEELCRRILLLTPQKTWRRIIHRPIHTLNPAVRHYADTVGQVARIH